MLRKSYPYYLANQPVAANTDLDVLDKYSGKRATPRLLVLRDP